MKKLFIILNILCFTFLASQVKAAIDLDGSDDYVLVTENAGLDTLLAGDFTVSVWAKIDDLTPYVLTGNAPTPFIAKMNLVNGPGFQGWALGWFTVSGTPRLYFATGADSVWTGDWGGRYWTTETLTTGTWYHMVVVRQGNNGNPGNTSVDLYIDGVAATVNDNGSHIAHDKTAYPMQIGKLSSTRDAYDLNFDGQLDDLRIYNRALTASEVEQLFKARSKRISGALANNMLVHYEMDEAEIDSQVITLFDSSGNANAGTANGGVSLQYTAGGINRH